MKNFNKIFTAVAIACALVAGQVRAATVTHFSAPITGTVGESSTNSQVGAASEVITFNPLTNVNSGDSVTIGAGLVGRATYTFTNATGTNIPTYGVALGTNFAQSCTNLLQAISSNSAGSGVNFGIGTPTNTLVSVVQSASNTITLTATPLNPGSLGNKITVTASQTSGEIQFPYNVAGLYGGYENTAAVNTGDGLGVTASVYFFNTNGAPVTNLTSIVIGAADSKTNLISANPTNVTPAITISAFQSGYGTSVLTNIPASLVTGAGAVGVIQTYNTSATNNVAYRVVFSWAENDGK